MIRTVWLTLRAFYGMETGRTCRACGSAISQQDAFGSSEGVCRTCRDRADSNV